MQTAIDSNAKNTDAKFALLDSKISSMNDMWKNELSVILNKHMKDAESKLVDVSKRIESNENKIELLERKSRINDIIIRGIPYKDRENLVNFFVKLAAEIKFPYDNMYSVSSIFRLGKPRKPVLAEASSTISGTGGADVLISTKPPPILVTFTTPRLKGAFCRLFNKCDNLNYNKIGLDGSTNRIYLTDNLTKTNSDILRKAIEVKASNRIDKVQVRNGIVLINHTNDPIPVKVHNIMDLNF